MNKWKEIWNNRKDDYFEDDTLAKLIALDGFDSGAGKINKKDWLDYSYSISQKLGIKNNESIFEFGCGSGALLYPMYVGFNVKVGGCDFSEILIKNANKYMKGNFFVSSVIDVNLNKAYDYTISNSVFQYFPSEQYARNVVSKMLKASKKKIAILDVNDKDKEDIAEAIRGDKKNKKFNDHRYYLKSFWHDIAVKEDCDITIEEQNIKEYGNSSFRYNVFLQKRK